MRSNPQAARLQMINVLRWINVYPKFFARHATVYHLMLLVTRIQLGRGRAPSGWYLCTCTVRLSLKLIKIERNALRALLILRHLV